MLKDVMANGLPPCGDAAAPCKHFVVVGGGIAGLTFSTFATEAGHNATLLEASDRVGGRVLTGTYAVVNLGAMRIPTTQTLVLQLVRQCHLSTIPFVEYNKNTPVFVNGVLTTAQQANDNPDAFGFEVNESEKGMTAAELWNRALAPVLDYVATHDWASEVVPKYDRFTVKEYLVSTGMSVGAIDMIGVFLNEETNFQTAFLEAVRDQIHISDTTKFVTIVGGTEKLTQCLLERAVNAPAGRFRLILNARVTDHRVARDGRAQETYVDSQTGEHVLVEGDAAVFTVTANAAQLIRFPNEPEWTEKRRAWRQVHYDCASKVFLCFKRQWWFDLGIYGGRAITDLPVRFVYYPSNNLDMCVLATYTWSQDSMLWSGLTDGEAIDLALRNLQDLHPTVNVREAWNDTALHEHSAIKHWCSDPYALGAFVLFTPYQERDLSRELATPVPPAFFAGEAMDSDNHGWMLSSLRSALQLVTLVTQPRQPYDIAIVGGGLLGLSTAVNAAMAGKIVVVVEQFGFENANGSSSADTRQFRQMYSETYLARAAGLAYPMWRELERQAGVARGTLLNTDTGYLFLGRGEDGMTVEGSMQAIRKTCEVLQQNCEYLNGQQMMERFPFSNLSSSYSGLYHQESGYINLEETLNELLKLARQFGVHLRPFEQMLDVSAPQTDGSSFGGGDSSAAAAEVFTLTTTRGQIRSLSIVAAPGAYVNDVLPRIHPQLHVESTVWELPYTFMNAINDTLASTLPTWFAFDGPSLFYGFPMNVTASDRSPERRGRVKIVPDFLGPTNPAFSDPSQRTHIPDASVLDKTLSWATQHASRFAAAPLTVNKDMCLINFVGDYTKDGAGFLLSHPPAFVPGSERIVLISGGWAAKFAPLWGAMAARLAFGEPLEEEWKAVLSHLSINRPGVLSGSGGTPSNALSTAALAGIALAVVTVVFAIFSVSLVLRRKGEKRNVLNEESLHFAK